MLDALQEIKWTQHMEGICTSFNFVITYSDSISLFEADFRIFQWPYRSWTAVWSENDCYHSIQRKSFPVIFPFVKGKLLTLSKEPNSIVHLWVHVAERKVFLWKKHKIQFQLETLKGWKRFCSFSEYKNSFCFFIYIFRSSKPRQVEWPKWTQQ